jgi:hypothetical protein
MTKKIIILTTILLIIVAITVGIGLNIAKIRKLAANHVDNLTATSTALVNDRNELVLDRLQVQLKTRELVSLSGNLREL